MLHVGQIPLVTWLKDQAQPRPQSGYDHGVQRVCFDKLQRGFRSGPPKNSEAWMAERNKKDSMNKLRKMEIVQWFIDMYIYTHTWLYIYGDRSKGPCKEF